MKKKSLVGAVQSTVVATPAPARRTEFADEFKRMAVERMRQGEKNPTELALELGIRRNQLYKWAGKLDEQGAGEVFRSPGRPPAKPETEVEELRRKLAVAEEELAILKKFDAYLTRHKQ